MDTRGFKPLYDGDGPWTSAYLPTSRDETDAARRIELAWRALREELSRQGAPEADLRAIDEVAGEDRGVAAPSGQAVFAADGSVVLARELSFPPSAPHGRFGDLPDALPLLAQTPDLGGYLLVLIDRREAVIELRPRGRADGRRAERTWWANTRDASRRVKELAGAYDVDVIAVGGETHARTLLLDQLGSLGRLRGVELSPAGFPPGADGAHARHAAERIAARREYAMRETVLDRYRRGLSDGSSVSGLASVVEALRAGEVATLLLRYDRAEADAPVWWGPEDGQLSLRPHELEGTRAPRIRRGRAADVLVRALVRTDGELLLYTGSEPGPDEVAGAVLRRG